MFKKIVSNISFSPALVGQLGFYAKRLSKEEATRKLGLIFTVLALILQSVIIIAPPQAANAASENDFIKGGFTTINEFLSHYDSNNRSIKDIFNGLGITRAEIAKASKTSINTSDKSILSWGRLPHFSTAEGERKYTFPTTNGGTVDAYARPLWKWDTYSSSTYTAFVGYSAKVGWFALLTNCGNLATKTYPVIQKCDENSTGIYPNCEKKTCPDGQIGTYPDCKDPSCPNGTIGTYPDCKEPSCPDGTVGTYPDCKQPPMAACDMLEIVSVKGVHSFGARSTVSSGAKITGYKYIISKDNKVIETKTVKSSETVNTLSYTQNNPGTYKVSLTVLTSEGEKTADSCVKTFTVEKPAVCKYNKELLAEDALCQPCPGDSSIWIKDEKCVGTLISTKKAENITQKSTDATKIVAQAGDRIKYHVSVTNNGKKDIEANFTEHLKDVLEYAEITDKGGGSFDKKKHLLTWASVTLAPNETQTRIFTVKVLDKIPEAARGTSHRASYDCKMTNTFGNSTTINVACPPEKQVEQVVAQLPKTGPTENAIFGAVLIAVVTYFYARSRQMKAEVRLIRKNLNSGSF